MNNQKASLRLRQLVVALIVVLTVEGILRKLAPSGVGIALFLLKDLIVTVMAAYLVRITPNPAIDFLWNAWKLVALLFVPLVAVTAWYDPLLAVFGAKQYLLFPMVAFAIFYAFENERMENVLTFYRMAAFLIIPTALLSLVQSHLPVDHWLNMSVNGDTMEGFSAGGQLRVSSSFSFVAQYCAFLNAELFFIMIALHNWKKQHILWRLAGITFLPLLVFSCLITGSRSAVAGDTSITLVAGALVLTKFKIRNLVQVSVVVVALCILVQAINFFSPDTTAAYSARENGKLIGISSEIQDRVFEPYFLVLHDKTLMSFFGHGLGVMSNGADTFSSYASDWRDIMWTESDFSTTFFEGGLYLGIIWYGFRGFIILATTLRYVQSLSEVYTIPLAFTQGCVIVIGAIANIGSQPPVAIWWWLSVGTSLLFWWKSFSPEPEIMPEDILPLPKKRSRGRSLYADVIHRK